MVRFGSARSNENGGLNGGKPGDQTGNEVSTQNWYLHPKGWVLIRAKDDAAREKIAKNMEAACANDCIGYCQAHRTSATEAARLYGYDLSKVRKDVEVDCSELVRICVMYAGISVGMFNTSSEAAALKSTGKFDVMTDTKYTNSPDYMCRGDILVTKTKGHTVVVLDNGDKAGAKHTENQKKVNSVEKNVDNPKKIDAARGYDMSLAGEYIIDCPLNLRTGAGRDAEGITVLPKDTVVRSYGYFTTAADGVIWLVVTTKVNGVQFQGFCSTKYMSKKI